MRNNSRAEADIFDSVSVGRRVLEIESRALQDLANNLGGEFASAVLAIHSATGRLICTGMGKSGHVARKIAATLASTGQPAFFVHPAEASHGDLGMIATTDVVLALSRSGEAKELSDVIAYCKRFAIPLIAMTADRQSALGKAGDIVLCLPDAPEATAEVNAPTTSTTLQIALGDALAVALLEQRGFTAMDFRGFHPGGKLGAMLTTVGDLMHAGDELPLVQTDASMQDALIVMSSRGWGIIGVVNGQGELVGAITDGDLRRHMGTLLSSKASEVMTQAPKTIGADVLASEALRLMNEPPKAVTALFVMARGLPIGLIHVHDLLRHGVA